VYGFSPDCAHGRAWSLTNVGFEEMKPLAEELRSGRRR
jgi:hypothetical protein